MNGFRLAVTVLVVLAAFSGCTKSYPGIDDIDMIPVSTLQATEGKDLIIEVIKDDQWVRSCQSCPEPVKATPQFVLWAEDAKGTFIGTLYITRKSAKQLWTDAGSRNAAGNCCLEALPYWLHQRRHAGMADPSPSIPLPDTITSATPVDNTVIFTKVPEGLDDAWVMLEINHAHDGSGAYPDVPGKGCDGSARTSGQPALVYGAKVDLRKPGKYEMNLMGHSSPGGDDCALSPDMTGITTATGIVKKIFVIYPD